MGKVIKFMVIRYLHKVGGHTRKYTKEFNTRTSDGGTIESF